MNVPPREVRATSIGAFAFQALARDRAAGVIGVTSRGVFVRIGDKRVIFVSFEDRRGPLTMTLDRPGDGWRALVRGAAAQVTSGRLIFPSIGIALSAAADVMWQPSPVSTPPRSIGDQLSTLRAIVHEVAPRKRGEGFGALLLPLLDLPAEAAPHDLASAFANISKLQQALRTRDTTRAVEPINELLGLGQGLTPSGDDCVLGVLRALNRLPQGDLQEFNQRVIEAAYDKTTLLSANLIECAANEQGDERLMNVVDGIIIGKPSIDACVECVLDWGNSSGVDALMGMALAVTM